MMIVLKRITRNDCNFPGKMLPSYSDDSRFGEVACRRFLLRSVFVRCRLNLMVTKWMMDRRSREFGKQIESARKDAAETANEVLKHVYRRILVFPEFILRYGTKGRSIPKLNRKSATMVSYTAASIFCSTTGRIRN